MMVEQQARIGRCCLGIFEKCQLAYGYEELTGKRICKRFGIDARSYHYSKYITKGEHKQHRVL